MNKYFSSLTNYIRNNKTNIFVPLAIATSIIIAFSLPMLFWKNGLIFVVAITIWFFFILDSMKVKIILFMFCELAFIFFISADSLQDILFAPILILAILFSGLLMLFLFVVLPVIISAIILINIFKIKRKLVKFILIVPAILYLYLISYNHKSVHHDIYRDASDIIFATKTSDNKLCFYIENSGLFLDTLNTSKSFTVSKIKLSSFNEQNVLWNKSYHENQKQLSSITGMENCIVCDANISVESNNTVSELLLLTMGLNQHSKILNRENFTYQLYFRMIKDKQTGELKIVKIPTGETARKEYEKSLNIK